MKNPTGFAITTDVDKTHGDLVAVALDECSLDELLVLFAEEDRHIAQAIRESNGSLIQRPWFSQQALERAVKRYRAEKLWPTLRELVTKGGKSKKAPTSEQIIAELRQAQAELHEAAKIIAGHAGPKLPRVADLFMKASERVSYFADRMEGKA
jgi:hypothetical protein